jgi:DNA-directed RNA polymerase subunit M/transcription elongation factor TFIIS
MEFCVKCDNIYYLFVNEEDSTLVHKCKNCGHVNTDITNKPVSVIRTNVGGKVPYHNVNEYTKYDPTIPHIDTLDCPNTECDTNTKGAKKRILYIRYSEANMSYVYLCSTCDHMWELKT